MRTREIVLVLFLALAPVTAMTIANDPTPATAFCDGWDNGYYAGWCYDDPYGCLAPMAPPCPYPEYDRDSYQDGYNRGLLKGMSDKQNPY